MTRPTCDACGKRVKAGTWTVVVNVPEEPTRRYHGKCFVDGREEKAGDTREGSI